MPITIQRTDLNEVSLQSGQMIFTLAEVFNGGTKGDKCTGAVIGVLGDFDVILEGVTTDDHVSAIIWHSESIIGAELNDGLVPLAIAESGSHSTTDSVLTTENGIDDVLDLNHAKYHERCRHQQEQYAEGIAVVSE